MKKKKKKQIKKTKDKGLKKGALRIQESKYKYIETNMRLTKSWFEFEDG